MHLSDYMAARGLSDEQVAAELGCSRPTVSRIRRRLCRPDWPTLLALDKFSYGAVTANDFLRLDVVKPNGGRHGRQQR
jgi:transcriptional regulator with XRE-family HTH domain